MKRQQSTNGSQPPQKKAKNTSANQVTVAIQWGECEAYRRKAAMFHSMTPESVAVKVWGAPCDLHIHQSVLQNMNCGLIDLQLRGGGKEASFSEDTLRTLYEPKLVSHSWFFVWTYFGLLHGLCLESVSTETSVWMNVADRLPLCSLLQVMVFSNFLSDTLLTHLLAASLDEAMKSTGFSLIPPLQRLLLRFTSSLHLPEIPDLIYSLFNMVSEEEPVTPDSASFCVSVLQTCEPPVNRGDKLLLTLERYEYRLYSKNRFGQYGDAKNRKLQACMIPLTERAWTNAYRFHHNKAHSDLAKQVQLAATRDGNDGMSATTPNLLVPELSIGLARLQLYWKHVFDGLPTHLCSQLFLSGSLIPMCMLTFYSHNFRLVVNSLFPEADMDVYITGEDAADVAKKVQAYLKQKHEHLYEESRTHIPENETHVVTLVLPTHPMHLNQSLRVQLIYYSNPDMTPQQVVIHHHLCPVRAYYLPASQEVVAAPSALHCWVTGYMTEYRLRNRNKVSLSSVLKYVTRKFGIDVNEQDAEEKGSSFDRLQTAVQQLKKLFPRFENLSHTSNFPDHKSILLALSPKLHLQEADDGTFCFSEEVQKMLHDGDLY